MTKRCETCRFYAATGNCMCYNAFSPWFGHTMISLQVCELWDALKPEVAK